MNHSARAFIASILIGLTACAELAAKRGEEDLSAGLLDVSAEVLTDVIAEKARLADLEYGLVTASAGYCGELNRPHVGAFVGGSATLETEWLRAAALRDHSIAENLTVLHVVPGGPFDRAGLTRGDEILAFQGAVPKTRPELLQFLVRQPKLKKALVRVRRDGSEWEREVDLKLGCPVVFELGAGTGITTWQSARVVIVVPRGLLRYADSDDVLAVVLGHQLAHALFDEDADDDLTAERRADRAGAIIATRAGYQVSGMIGYWEDAARAYPWLITPARARPKSVSGRYGRFRYQTNGSPHQDIARRMQGMRDVVAEIESRRQGARP